MGPTGAQTDSPSSKAFPWERPLSIFAQESGSGGGLELGYSPWRTAGEDKLTCARGWGSRKALLSLRLEPQRSWGSKGAADPPFQPLPRDGVGAALGQCPPRGFVAHPEQWQQFQSQALISGCCCAPSMSWGRSLLPGLLIPELFPAAAVAVAMEDPPGSRQRCPGAGQDGADNPKRSGRACSKD